jgi:PilZ domain
MRLQDKRRSRRIRIGQPIKVRVPGSKDRQFEEVNVTRNVARDGIYFLSPLADYHEGMRLYVTVPYHTPPESQDREYLGQVVRVERLADQQSGVAVKFLTEVKGQ